MTGAVVGGMKALSQSAGSMAEWGGKGSFGKNALSLANAVGGKAMSMMGQAASAGVNAAMYRNPAYQGYQNAISLLGNKSNGLLTKDVDGKTRANANGGGVTPSEMLENLDGNKSPATTATEKFSSAAMGIANTADNIKNTIQKMSKKTKE